MRYIIVGLLVVVMIQVFFTESVAEQQDDSDYIVIPDEAIRLRILADSNDEEAQKVKEQVRDKVNEQITEWVEELTSIEVARETIIENLPKIEEIVADVTGDDDFTVEFGDIQFPDKVYDRFVYPGGEYEAILITLGSGEGDNWWCVLFPPLCFVEFADGTTVLEHDDEEEVELEEEQEAEVSFFLWDWLKKLLGIS
ncbi:stage II sporulation protein R [Alkalibacillus haloalkaliphilus]|uniref:stage II sporulation protein R n=1 Tax=Alkalibacillus haloalkaliphilus TaxID=94136 RepID=UPI0003155358|nr:stage II sporulation protein R [Alkalibacillus haloalkaliphilus]